MSAAPLILYIPGLKSKPPPGVHIGELWKCLLEGVRRSDPQTAEHMRARDGVFDIVGWNYDFYGEHRDIEVDRAGIAAVLRQREATARDKAEARTLKRRTVRSLYRLADRLPFLIPQVADENLELHLRDLRRYVKNDDDLAEATRRLVKLPLRAAWRSERPILLIGHSMGSVIAWDALWQMSRESGDDARVDLITMGSPLGQRTIQRKLLGSTATGPERYPDNIGRWVNIAAIGELTAIDMKLGNDYAEMIALGLVDAIEDYEVYNFFHYDGELNVHAEYGYLVNEVTGKVVSDWWRRATGVGARLTGDSEVINRP
jgi:pimeloyl-ACP methyl ester carboxylesterase